MQGRPFVPYEWGSEVLFALSHRVAGLPGVLAVTAIGIASAYFLLYILLRRLGVDPLLAFGTSIAAGLVGAFHWLARPHVFSLVMVVGLMFLLETTVDSRQSITARRPLTVDRRPFWTFLLFALWSNLHGGFLFGLVLIGFYLVGDVIGMVLEHHRVDHRSSLKRHLMLLGAALVGCCINPSGPMILPHVAGYLGKTWLVDMTMEYRSPDFHQWYGRVFLMLLVLAVAALALIRRRLSWPHLVVFLGTTAFALHSARNIPLWALTALPLVALHANPSWRRIGWTPIAQMRESFAMGSHMARPGVWSGMGAAALVGLALSGGTLAGTQLLLDKLDPGVFPVEVVAHARSEGLQGRMFNELTWGGYILNAWPEQKVFIDGQTDLYGVTLSKLYASLRSAEPGWKRRLDSLCVEFVLLPADAPLSSALERMPDWTKADSVNGVLYTRRLPSRAWKRDD